MKTRTLSVAPLALAFGVGLAACPSSTPGPKGPATGDVGATSSAAIAPIAPIASASDTTAPTTEPSSTATLKSAAGAVKSPVFSTDACNVDADCLPVATCHSSQCAAVANAGTMPKGMLCTMDCRGGTVDCGFNHCGCAAAPSGGKKCALLPGGKP